MVYRPVLQWPNSALKRVSEPVLEFDDELQSLIKDMYDTLNVKMGAGLAAPQIGVGVRAFSYNVDGEIGYVLNPVLVSVSGEPELVGEGCLSVPGLWHDTLRYPHAVVHGIDLDGNPVVLEGEGLMAQALQHETDHLDGTLYLDRLDPARRKQAMREVRESDWF